MDGNVPNTDYCYDQVLAQDEKIGSLKSSSGQVTVICVTQAHSKLYLEPPVIIV